MKDKTPLTYLEEKWGMTPCLWLEESFYSAAVGKFTVRFEGREPYNTTVYYDTKIILVKSPNIQADRIDYTGSRAILAELGYEVKSQNSHVKSDELESDRKAERHKISGPITVKYIESKTGPIPIPGWKQEFFETEDGDKLVVQFDGRKPFNTRVFLNFKLLLTKPAKSQTEDSVEYVTSKEALTELGYEIGGKHPPLYGEELP